jgi:hypothetical protein
LGERWLCKPEVGGSSPPTSTILLKRNILNQAGSNQGGRS